MPHRYLEWPTVGAVSEFPTTAEDDLLQHEASLHFAGLPTDMSEEGKSAINVKI